MKPENPRRARRLLGETPRFLGGLSIKATAVGAAAEDPAGLDRLRDIVTLPPVPWWPPAPGWHVLAVGLLLALLFVLARWFERRRANAYRRAALRELDALEQSDRWHEVPVLLKRVALAAFPRTEVARLTGEGWVNWLNRHAGGAIFTGKPALLLAANVYRCNRAQALAAEDWRGVTAAVRAWIRSHH